MHALVTALSVVSSLIFALLAVVGLRRWRRRRDVTAGWIALAFLSLGLIVTFGRLVPAHPHGLWQDALQRIEIELLVLFPYLMYRFATAFVPPSRRLQRIVSLLTVGLTVWTFALPDIPAAGEKRSTAFLLYVIAFLVHWTLLSVVVTVRLWRAGLRQPSVSRKRMQMLSFASAALTIAIIGTAFVTDNSSVAAAVVQVLAILSGAGFLLGLDPPQLVRVQWRQVEQERLQEAIRSLMTLATSRKEIAQRVLGPSADLVGAKAAVVLDAEGNVLAEQAVPSSGEQPVRVDQPGATLLMWTSPYAPFFGEDEIRVLDTVAALLGIALERANELMTNFVALAAHELRTPVTTIHGFVQTLNHLDDRLDEGQKDELRVALEQQTARMASLVEQLLDLSRLDADAVEVRPQRFDLRRRLEDVVRIAAGPRAADVSVLVEGGADANVDPSIVDHIVTNLVTNALRYGQAPVEVIAVVENGSVHISVEDAGPGVASEIEETLFERFTRAGVARDRVAGTGLGLAIARAYARAHRGDLRYEPGQPSGARFVVDLPTAS